MHLQQNDENLSNNKRPPMLRRIAQGLRRIPLWLRIVGGVMLMVLTCGMLIGLVLAVFGMGSFSLGTDCSVDGGPGESAHLNNGGAPLFTFPKSTANIWGECGIWQETFVHVRFTMDADELEPFLDSMRWDVRPLIVSSDPPPFGEPQPNATYLYGKYSDPAKSLSVGVWIDNSRAPYWVFVSILYY